MSGDERPPEEATASQTTEERLASITIGERTPLNGTIHLAAHDPEWLATFSELAARIRAALADRALLLEHVGSTSVPGLRAKPVIDIVLAVADSSEESSYVPALEDQGFRLRIREPDWFEHRLLKCTEVETNLHVFSSGCAEIDRMLAFRDRLRCDEEDRRLYEQAKLDLAARTWMHTQSYADAKSEVVRAILERAAPGLM
jgi:GrpB-like predicted nucleotidyltransferase (UPF0157 family)